MSITINKSLMTPLRYLNFPIRAVRNLYGIVVNISHTGGYVIFLRKLFAFAQREGLKGFVRRLNMTKDSCNDYRLWIEKYDTLSNKSIDKIRLEMSLMTYKPLISIVMPVYNAPLRFLQEAIESVQAQIYENWELCIADDASTDKLILNLLDKYSASDSRIKIIRRDSNGHISAASNSALKLATGDYIALLDQDDKLPTHSLYYVAKAIIKNPNVALIYSDEDKIDVNGVRHDPYFKCGWNLDMQYSHNMFCHLGVYKRDLINSIGGFRLGFEGSQDYDLLLRCIERIEASQIVHIPYVLYHWRVHSESTAMSSDAKPYAMVAGERAINEHFSRMGVNGSVKLIGYGYKVSYSIPYPAPLVSIVIPTRNARDLVLQCINSIRRLTTYPSYEIILVDNGSDEEESLKEWSTLENGGIKLIRDNSPFNYAALNNKAVEAAKGQIVALLNNDTEVIEPKWLEIMVGHALRPGVGAVGAKLLYPNNTIQHAGVVLGMGGLTGAAGHIHYNFPSSSPGYFGRISLTSSFSAVTAACLVVRRDLYLKVGGFDAQNLKVAFNDVDFCLRLNAAGYRCVYAPDAVLYHHESATRGAEDDPEKWARFQCETKWMRECWGDLIDNDPNYSPNLTLNRADCSLAWPPRVAPH